MWIAVDPGRSIGVAVRLDDGGYRTMTLDHHEELYMLIAGHHPEMVAYETFSTGGRVDADQLYTIELVGGIQAVCFLTGVNSHGQVPQSRKSFMEEAEQIVMDYSKAEGRTESAYELRHEIDAMAHMLLMKYRHEAGEYT